MNTEFYLRLSMLSKKHNHYVMLKSDRINVEIIESINHELF